MWELIEICSELRNARRRAKCGPNEAIKLGERATLRRATGETREMIVQVLDIVPVMDELPVCEFIRLSDFVSGKSRG